MSALVLGIPFLYLISITLTESSGAILCLKKIWGDWGFHFALTMAYAYRPISTWLEHPLLIDYPLHYPALINLFSGLLIRLHSSIVFAFWLPSTIAATALVALLHRFAYQQYKRPASSLLFACLFVFAGGMGFAYRISQQLHNVDYTYLSDHNIFYGNPIAFELLPQRSFLLAMPWMLWVLTRIWAWRGPGFQNVSTRSIYATAFAAGCLSYLHPSSLIALFFFCAFLFIQEIDHWRKILQFGVTTSLTAIILYSLLLRGSGGNHFFVWQPGWYSSEPSPFPMNFLEFWWWNGGLFFPLSLWAVYRMKLWRHPYVQAGWTLFALANLIRIYPWLWDNTKIFLWAHIGIALPIVFYFEKLWDEGLTMGRASVVTCSVILCTSGALDVARIFTWEESHQLMWSKEDLRLAQILREKTDPSARILTADDSHHWVTLAGRAIFLGYGGWFWSHGTDTREREAKVKAVYKGGLDAEKILKELKVEYVVVGPLERERLQANESYFRNNFPLLMNSEEWRVYKIVKN